MSFFADLELNDIYHYKINKLDENICSKYEFKSIN